MKGGEVRSVREVKTKVLYYFPPLDAEVIDRENENGYIIYEPN